MRKNSRNRKKVRKLNTILLIIAIILSFILGYFIFKANILPIKYFIGIVVVLLIILLVYGLLALNKKTKLWAMIILNIIILLFVLIEAFAILKIDEALDFLKNNLGLQYENIIYYVLVNNDSEYRDIKDIAGLTIKSYQDIDDMREVENKLKEVVNVNFEYLDSINEVFDTVIDDKEEVILVSAGYYDLVVENDETYEEDVRILYTIEIKILIESSATNVDVTTDPFIIYLSGIDTRSGTLPSRSLSDVNIIMAVNPNTKKILMVHIPRDYYVQISGTTGLKDKLTHTGTIGGVSLTIATVEDLLNVEIPYYIRVNFNAVVNLVDSIGGINVYSDIAFTAHTNRSCSYNVGNNFVDGTCALAFARERYAYTTGDRHRGENQEQVIEKIIEKVSSSKTLISNYSKILSSLNGTFETNLTTNDITSLIKMQLNDMTSWDITSYNLDGTGLSTATYSYPNQDLYVMIPDEGTINTAITKINEVLNN